MLYNKRTFMFETNSSSCHSITVADHGALKNSLEISKNNTIISRGGEFGWEPEEFNDAQTKLDYLVTFIFYNYIGKEKKLQIDEFTDKNLHYYEKLCKAIEDFTGCILEVLPSEDEDEFFPIGYIDHQSYGVAKEILSKTVGYIKRFIFNPKSILYIDNDNRY